MKALMFEEELSQKKDQFPDNRDGTFRLAKRAVVWMSGARSPRETKKKHCSGVARSSRKTTVFFPCWWLFTRRPQESLLHFTFYIFSAGVFTPFSANASRKRIEETFRQRRNHQEDIAISKTSSISQSDTTASSKKQATAASQSPRGSLEKKRTHKGNRRTSSSSHRSVMRHSEASALIGSRDNMHVV